MDYDPDETIQGGTTDVIKTSLQLYGSIFAVVFSIYVIVRPKFPLTYNFCNSVREYNTKLSSNHHGHVKWIWKNLQYSDDELFENCGFTAIVFLRFLRMGIKIAAIGVCNSIYLIPVNLNGCIGLDTEEECNAINDSIDKIGLGHLSQGSTKLLATTVAAYVLFGSTLYFIYKEFEWYTDARHKFLSLSRPDNYSVYVAHIPEEFREDEALSHYFKSIFDSDAVSEANIALDINGLEQKVANRDSLLDKLQHALNLRRIKGYEPTHLILGKKVQSIPHYTEDLNKVNDEICETLESITQAKEEDRRRFLLHNVGGSPASISSMLHELKILSKDRPQQEGNVNESKLFLSQDLENGSPQSYDDELNPTPKHHRHDTSTSVHELKILSKDRPQQEGNVNESKLLLSQDLENGSPQSYDDELNPTPKHHRRDTSTSVFSTISTTIKSGVKNSASLVHKNVKQIGEKSMDITNALIRNNEDGKVRDAGFVTFTSLAAKNQCVQMIHHKRPFTFEVKSSPLPDQIYWGNIGLDHKKQQLGYLVAQLLTLFLCVFWTIPVSFVSSLSEIESLKTLIPSLGQAVEKYPWIESILAQLNPILIVVLKAMLPKILRKFCEREGHISETDLNASLLSKLSQFLIIQIFFVPAISGSIFASLPVILNEPAKIIDLLAKSVPGQVKSFIQFVMVNVLLACSLELLRIVKVIKAYIRQRVGPNLTEEEQKTVFMGLEPLTVPDEMDFTTAFSEIVLFLMILLVYSCIAPIMSYVMLVMFVVLFFTYLNQFIYIYNSATDEGGTLWPKMVKITLSSVLIAEFTLIGIMSIKQSIIASTLLIPLICITILFMSYLEQQHYKVTNFLPSTECKIVDRDNKDEDKSFLKGCYIQPALKEEKIKVPSELENSDDDGYDTPKSSTNQIIQEEA